MKNRITICNKILFSILIVILVTRINQNNISATSSSSWKGYAVYRDGVVNNLNDHAALMYSDKVTSTGKVVVQASGPNTYVGKETWSTFKDGNSFICCSKPQNCTMTYGNRTIFASKAYQLIGIAYTYAEQLYYVPCNDNSTLEYSDILNIRCDGVVEYVYEYYGYRVGGSNSYWNITINNTNNLADHLGLLITPRTQRQYYLTTSNTVESDMY